MQTPTPLATLSRPPRIFVDENHLIIAHHVVPIAMVEHDRLGRYFHGLIEIKKWNFAQGCRPGQAASFCRPALVSETVRRRAFMSKSSPAVNCGAAAAAH